MTSLKQIIGGLLMTAVVAVVPVAAQADDQDTIDYRKHVMATLGSQAGALFMILQQKAPPDNFANHVKALALTATQSLSTFEPNVEGGTSKGEAKPEVWSNWDDFSARMNELVENLAELDRVAQEGGMEAAAPMVKEAFTCRGCHEEYRHAG